MTDGGFECPNCGRTGPSVPVWPSVEAFTDPDAEPALVGCTECGEMERYLDDEE